jgi:hypothetical protein
MYKIMYNEIGHCGVAHRLRCYEDCEKLLRVRFKSPSFVERVVAAVNGATPGSYTEVEIPER